MTGTPEAAAGEPVPVTDPRIAASPDPDPKSAPTPAPRSAPRSAPQPSEPPVLPEQTKDDLDEDYRDRPQDDDDRFTRERPPHW